MRPALLLFACLAQAQEFRSPAGDRPVIVRPAGSSSILPGGRIITPHGQQFMTGPGPFGLAVSPNLKTVITSDGGPRVYTLTALHRDDRNRWRRNVIEPSKVPGESGKDEPGKEWSSVFMGIAFEDDKTVFASEGNSGRVRLLDLKSGRKKHLFDLNQAGFRDSYSGDLAFDPQRHLLYVVDQANFRLAIFDTRKRQYLASARVGRMPFAVALSPDGHHAYVTNTGMFEYKAIPGADPKRPRETGLGFPAFGFPSPDSRNGAPRETLAGQTVNVPGLGDPNVPESNSLCIISTADPANPKIEAFLRTGLAFGGQIHGGSSPSGVVATQNRVFVSNAHNDEITIVDPAARKVVGAVSIRIPGLERYRGVLPIGMAYHEASGWLFVAEAGINAVAVVDTRSASVLGHIPAPWFPTRVAVAGDDVYVASAKGYGTGPNATKGGPAPQSFHLEMRRGTVSLFPVPGLDDLPRLTGRVFANNGFVPQKQPAPKLPQAIEHIVLIVKENRTYDEVFGDILNASNGPANGIWDLARFGRTGNVHPARGQLQQRFSLRSVNVTPNHHALAERFAFSDNFYVDSEVSVDGHHWLVGSYPNAWLESTVMASGRQKDFRMPTDAPGRLRFVNSNSSVHPDDQPEAGVLWHHLDRHGISFRNYGEGFELAGVDEGPGLKPTGASFLTNVPMPDPLYRNTSRTYPQYNTNIPDQFRATQFIREVDEMFVKSGKDLPRFVYIHLPNDHMAKPRPEDGYPVEASFVADNDYALGRIVDYLSHSKWWPRMAIFITEDDAQGGVDHIDSHRTVLLLASPFARKNYVSHTNASFPGLLKTIFRLLNIPPLNLFDASAGDLSGLFTDQPDPTPFKLLPADSRIFDPAKAREPLDPKPVPPMDDPAVLREQHRRR